MQRPLKHLVQTAAEWHEDKPREAELLKGIVQLFLLIAFALLFVAIGVRVAEAGNPLSLAERLIHPLPILALFVVPFGAWLLVFVFGAAYLQDIYDLDEFAPAFRYMFSCIFALFYPKIVVDGGKFKEQTGRINTIEEIGGPGFAIIEPGNSVIFRRLRRPSQISLPMAYCLRPFETLGAIASLDDQHDSRDAILAVTRDGIQVHLREINFRYRLLPSSSNGIPRTRTPLDPYPFSQEAMLDMAYSGAADDTPQAAVGRVVVGAIKSFISTHEIDYLTAPRQDGQNPRFELRIKLFAEEISHKLRTLGTELIWIDIGHFDIIEFGGASQDGVDGQRLSYWASRWCGDIALKHAKGKAKIAAYKEKGRVEAQAEMLTSIMETLKGFETSGNPAEHMRKILLAGTTQILEAMIEASAKQGGKNHD